MAFGDESITSPFFGAGGTDPISPSNKLWVLETMDGPHKYTMPAALREKLLQIALETDVIAEYRGVESWRIAAVSGARWLLRCAAESDDIPRMMTSSLRKIAALAKRMSTYDTFQHKRTISGELTLELEKFLDDED